MTDDAGPGAVLVHGLWHGGWVWDEVGARLSAAGVPWVAVDLPLTDLDADVAATRAVLEEFDRPTVLVGHSYGGAAITGAGDHPRVQRLIYLAAFQLAEGESVGRALPDLDLPPTRLGEGLRFSDSGDEVSLDPELGAELLYNGAPQSVVERAMARLRPVRRAVFSGVPHTIAWQTVESTYVICADDLVVNPDLERAMAERATTRVEWQCGHSPAASDPQKVADLIIAATER